MFIIICIKLEVIGLINYYVALRNNLQKLIDSGRIKYDLEHVHDYSQSKDDYQVNTINSNIR